MVINPEDNNSKYFKIELHSEKELDKMFAIRFCVFLGKCSDWITHIDKNFVRSKRPKRP